MNQTEYTQKTSCAAAFLKQKEKIAAALLLALLSICLLGEDSRPFLAWWAAIWILGCSFLPLTGMLFSGFRDKGWMFSKAIAIACTGYLTWLLVSLGLLPFTPSSCFAISFLCIAANFALAYWQKRTGRSVFPSSEGRLVFWEEALLFLAFLLWTYAAGFRPQAFGEEKFMDFGFMAAMMRSDTLPATDIWYSLAPINYYYGGQYYAVFLTKLTGTQISATYHLMRTLVAGMAFALPFSLVRQVAQDYFRKSRFCSVSKKNAHHNAAQSPFGAGSTAQHAKIPDGSGCTAATVPDGYPQEQPPAQAPPKGKAFPAWKKQNFLALCSGLLSGIAVSLAGNMHYVIYGIILPLLTGQSYWFPDSTRYIGHNPPTADEPIHEFPAYSFLQGDLHAHVVNVFFVLTVLGLLYAWVKQERNGQREHHAQNPPSKLPLIACSVFLGIFQWSNAWDFAIYYVILCGTCLFCNLSRLQSWKKGISASLAQWLWTLALSLLVALPFTSQFDSGMAQGICLAQNHSAFYQLCILWGLPVSLAMAYLLKLALETKRHRAKVCAAQPAGQGQPHPKNSRPAPLRWLAHIQFPDLYMAVLSLCAMGLVLVPELIYLRDIYEETSARSNTMFKLTYQAFILFGIFMGFLLVRFLSDNACKWAQLTGVLGLCCLFLTSGYTATAAKQWYGELWDRSGYQGLNATLFLETEYPADAPAIRWLQENVSGSPVLLEAPGDSYSKYCRVSAMTGLPTVEGWYVHEWLWRGDTEDLNEKKAEIETIYTSEDEEEVWGLLAKYHVEYIFVGQMEWESYPALNLGMLKSFGDVVFDNGTVVIQVMGHPNPIRE